MGVAVGLVYDRVRWEEKALAKKIRERQVVLRQIDAKSLLLDASSNNKELKEHFGEVILQRCISYFRGLHVSAFFESKGLKVVNPFRVIETCGNKLLTTLALERAGIPTPKTVLSFTPEAAMKAVEEVGYPAVLKPVTGSWGRLVVPLKDKESAQALIEVREQLSNPLDHIYYVQKFVERPPRDIRSVVVGDSLVAAVYRHSPPHDWRTNVARGAKTSPYPITGEFEELILKAAEAVGGGFLGIDAMEGRDGMVIHEVNSNVEFRGAATVSSADIPGAVIDYLLNQVRR